MERIDNSGPGWRWTKYPARNVMVATYSGLTQIGNATTGASYATLAGEDHERVCAQVESGAYAGWENLR